VAGGLAEGKMVRVVGLAETLPLDPANPNLPINRRISIIVLNKQAEAAMRGDSKKLEVSAGNELEASDIRAGLKSGARPPLRATKETGLE
jgi:chemotaxis protein MotB